MAVSYKNLTDSVSGTPVAIHTFSLSGNPYIAVGTTSGVYVFSDGGKFLVGSGALSNITSLTSKHSATTSNYLYIGTSSGGVYRVQFGNIDADFGADIVQYLHTGSSTPLESNSITAVSFQTDGTNNVLGIAHGDVRAAVYNMTTDTLYPSSFFAASYGSRSAKPLPYKGGNFSNVYFMSNGDLRRVDGLTTGTTTNFRLATATETYNVSTSNFIDSAYYYYINQSSPDAYIVHDPVQRGIQVFTDDDSLYGGIDFFDTMKTKSDNSSFPIDVTLYFYANGFTALPQDTQLDVNFVAYYNSGHYKLITIKYYKINPSAIRVYVYTYTYNGVTLTNTSTTNLGSIGYEGTILRIRNKSGAADTVEILLNSLTDANNGYTGSMNLSTAATTVIREEASFLRYATQGNILPVHGKINCRGSYRATGGAKRTDFFKIKYDAPTWLSSGLPKQTKSVGVLAHNTSNPVVYTGWTDGFRYWDEENHPEDVSATLVNDQFAGASTNVVKLDVSDNWDGSHEYLLAATSGATGGLSFIETSGYTTDVAFTTSDGLPTNDIVTANYIKSGTIKGAVAIGNDGSVFAIYDGAGVFDSLSELEGNALLLGGF